MAQTLQLTQWCHKRPIEGFCECRVAGKAGTAAASKEGHEGEQILRDKERELNGRSDRRGLIQNWPFPISGIEAEARSLKTRMDHVIQHTKPNHQVTVVGYSFTLPGIS